MALFCRSKGCTSPVAFHASRRATRFYSLSLPFAAWWSPQGSDDTAARARTVRVRPSWSVWQRARRAQMGGMEVSAERHKSACRSTAGEDQQGLRVCVLEGRRWLQACSTRYGCSARAMPTRLWAAGCSQPCHGARCLCRRLERNSSGRCDCCAPECWRHDLSRCVWCYIILENTFRQ